MRERRKTISPADGPDMRKWIPFPDSVTRETVYDPTIQPWRTACALVGKYDSRQYNTYRKYWFILGDPLFRDVLEVTRNILIESHGIRSRAGFLTAQFATAMTTSALT